MVMTTWARIEGGVVAAITKINTERRFHPSMLWVACPDDVSPGWTFDGATFVPPLAEPKPLPTGSDVDAERDRRISAGFEFSGVRYQSRLAKGDLAGDWDIISGKALEAFMAVVGGAQPGNLRWSDPAQDFAWIAEDNSRVPMDALAVIELGKAASAHRSKHTFAGSDLKAMSPIPADYTDNKWWP